MSDVWCSAVWVCSSIRMLVTSPPDWRHTLHYLGGSTLALCKVLRTVTRDKRESVRGISNCSLSFQPCYLPYHDTSLILLKYSSILHIKFNLQKFEDRTYTMLKYTMMRKRGKKVKTGQNQKSHFSD